MPTALVRSVALSAEHVMSKASADAIELRVGHGVVGDCHAGSTVQHLSRIRRDPTQPNLRQVHLIQAELFDEVAVSGFTVAPGDLGENVTTAGIDLLGLPTGSVLRFPSGAALTVTGLRNPCRQIDGLQHGLLSQMLGRSLDGAIVRRAGVMAVVLAAGVVRPGDEIRTALPAKPHRPLGPV